MHQGWSALPEGEVRQQRQLAGPVDTRFEGLEVVLSPNRSITLADGLASFETTIYDEVVAGDHTIVLLGLHAVQRAEATSPLVFHGSVFRRLMVD